ncbi:prepilin-type N-terminal cleavage/methylation domain-containing protein [Ornithinibacillus massiliensis]|uniref:Prepilin-type N-terminal cleavage/methylation domain-containing protein n=1 Tax=Ornithinibacillus massiliensis TaxID=1944633 RepID=A0ABS5MI88_9BACI|nr:prepilin-type N-terminal cleavage/methylation domain-containing protein [Ornithinibacillus massiliensis]MBS3682028.1 prepilin-type N-terminal cleavage/methylation domain-containing protein [Ornithinibacillus massiliensis]
MKKFLKRLKKDERGLTLVELLAVIVILGIVGVIAFVAIGNVIDNSKKDAHIANAQQVISAVELLEASGDTLNGSEDASEIDSVGKLTDPWDTNNNGYDFTVERSDSRNAIVISSVHSECSFTNATKSNLIKDGRDACGKTYTVSDD